MSRYVTSLVVLGIAAVAIGCAPAGSPPGGETGAEALKASIQEWFDAVNAGDAARVSALYAADAVRLPPNEPEVRGSDAIRAGFEDGFAGMSSLEIEWQSEELHISFGWAVEWGFYSFTGTLSDSGEPVAESGRAAWSWSRDDDGSWKIDWEIWNLDHPVAAPLEEPE